MRASQILSSLGASVLCLSIVFAAYRPASADGSGSQWKSRLPQGAPVTDTFLSGSLTVMSSEDARSAREREAVAAIIRRNIRAQERRTKLVQETNVMTAAYAPSVTDRTRQALKLYRVAAVKCGTLHTHERAQCMYVAQLEAGRTASQNQ